MTVKHSFNILDKTSSKQNRSNKHETRLISAVKAVFSPGDVSGNLDDLYKLMFFEENHKIISHSKLIAFLTKRITQSRAVDVAKLFVVALVPSDEDPISVAIELSSQDT